MLAALISLDASIGDNMRETEDLLRLSVQNGAVIAFLPELSYGGYRLNERHLADYSYEDALATYSLLAKRYSIAIGFGVSKRLSYGKYTNRYIIVSSSGSILAEYDKTHIFSFGGEKELFEPGDSLSTFELDGILFGVSICYDLRFAEIFSIYSKSCDVVLCPSAWPKKRISHYKLLLKARAVENALEVVGINWQGVSPDGIEYTKSSFVSTSGGHFKKAVFRSSRLDIFELAKRKNITVNSVPDKRFAMYEQLLKISK